jgi:hypothetical protein
MKIYSNSLISETAPESSPWTSEALHTGYCFSYAVQIKCLSGSLTVKLQCSSDTGDQMNPINTEMGKRVTNWTDITGALQILAAGDDVTFDASELGYNWVRVVIVGSGQIEVARISRKAV